MGTLLQTRAGHMHKVTKAGAEAPYRFRCVVCERQFLNAPLSINLDAGIPQRILESESQAAAAPGAPGEAPAPDSEPLFVAVKCAVMAGADHVATAVSKTMAKRIAAALNKAKKERY